MFWLIYAAALLGAPLSSTLLVPPPSRRFHALRPTPLWNRVQPTLSDAVPAPKSTPFLLQLALAVTAVVPLPAHASAQEALQLLEGYQTRTPDNVVWYALIGLTFMGSWYFNKLLASF